MINRILKSRIISSLFSGETIILYGARYVGKTTLAKDILAKFGDDGGYYNCKMFSVQNALSAPEPERLKTYFGNKKIIVLDDAHVISDIGKILQTIADELPEIQVIATGSSSFDIANKTNEPLTGRAIRFTLFPLSLQEISDQYGLIGLGNSVERMMRMGSYPEVFSSPDEISSERLDEIASNYLYKDFLMLENIKRSEVLKNLLISLSLQVGSEVTYNELSNRLGINKITVQKYIDLLEQSFIIFRLYSFSRNLRNEITKSVKIYFFDLGIRNSLIQNFNPLDIRQDKGMLWENFCVAERIKYLHNSGKRVNSYFWRTYDQKEVDYVEESGGKITGFEFKYSKDAKVKSMDIFKSTYDADINVVNIENYEGFLLGSG
ncbi:MAG: ATP-binding protein [Ignavibacteria bacterium]|nr:ATP-binding protein [Ignavibacteria bacterium]